MLSSPPHAIPRHDRRSYSTGLSTAKNGSDEVVAHVLNDGRRWKVSYFRLVTSHNAKTILRDVLLQSVHDEIMVETVRADDNSSAVVHNNNSSGQPCMAEQRHATAEKNDPTREEGIISDIRHTDELTNGTDLQETAPHL